MSRVASILAAGLLLAASLAAGLMLAASGCVSYNGASAGLLEKADGAITRPCMVE